MRNISPSVLITSVLNPNMRTFDVVMHTEYGTSYNSYVVKGADKTALIDAAHATFATNYLENLEEVLAGQIPDYLVLNHCEPDHTGCIDVLLDRYPGLLVLVSQAGSIYIKDISNRPDLNLRVVKDGDTLDLGGRTLYFISAPFLHWPDSIFTWLPEDKILFTCDFLGAHYCEPQMFDYKVVYNDAYHSAVRNYFAGIFEPFKPYVLKGLEKMEGLDINFACTSHGPILTKGGSLEEVRADYLRWATPAIRFNKLIPVFYVSAYGNTQQLAQAVARGVLSVIPDAKVACYDLNEHDSAKMGELINCCDAFLLGSPTINRDSLTPMWKLLAEAEVMHLSKKPAALFGSYGWSGEAIPNLANRLTDLKATLFEERFRVKFVPTPQDLEAAEQFGARFAALTVA